MDEVKQQIESGGESADIDVDLRLTVLKPLHTVWLVDLYNHLSSLVGVGHIAKGWEKAGISGLLDGHSYSVNMYYTVTKHKDNVFDYAYGTLCGFYNLVLL